VFREECQDFQFSFLGQNGLTNITNAGNAEINGVEATLEWAVSNQLRMSAAATFLDAQLTKDFCKQLGSDGAQLNPIDCIADNPDNFTPWGTELAAMLNFKGNVTARYIFELGDL
jgi:outer membrane receptor protein involved in Fe transport